MTTVKMRTGNTLETKVIAKGGREDLSANDAKMRLGALNWKE